MDFILDNIYVVIVIAAAIAQWLKSSKEGKNERESEKRAARELEEFIEQAERRHSKPSVPPPLPRTASPTPPRMDRSPTPMLKKANRPNTETKVVTSASRYQEELMQAELARQAAIAEQIKELKLAKKKQDAPQTTQREKATTAASGSIRERLKNRSELRQAFVLKEFLEKPVGLR